MKYINRTNIGWLATGIISALLIMSSMTKLFGSAEGLSQEMGVAHIMDWIKIIGIGELISVILFNIPKTMKLGTVLLSAYFGGAIMFHMAHADPMYASFISPAGFLVAIWAISWIRGNALID